MIFRIETLGCKVNQYETQAMETMLVSRGHTEASGDAMPDAVIINTCAVTAESGRKSRQAVRRAQKDYPGAFIAVCGCYSQISPEDSEALGADLVSGSGGRGEFIDELERLLVSRRRAVLNDDPMGRRIFEELPGGSMGGRTRAMLKIQDGCSNFCSYCIIPYARGPVRSLPLEAAAEEAARLAAQGYMELVVTGIEISSYGKDLDGVELIDAVERICKSAPGARIRLGSLEPRTITREFASRAAALPNLCPHFHLSLQSGCDETLKRMCRRYDSARFYESVSLLKEHFSLCGLTSDLIVGFPGETDAEFDKTLAFIEKCGFSDMHIFPYSRRPGTPAAKMSGQIPNAVKHGRAAAAAKAAERMSADFRAAMAGAVVSVLFETEENGVSRGHAGNYVPVDADGSGLRNSILPVQITGEKDGVLCGNILYG